MLNCGRVRDKAVWIQRMREAGQSRQSLTTNCIDDHLTSTHPHCPNFPVKHEGVISKLLFFIEQIRMINAICNHASIATHNMQPINALQHGINMRAM